MLVWEVTIRPVHRYILAQLPPDRRSSADQPQNKPAGRQLLYTFSAGPGAFGAEVGAASKSFGRVHAGLGGSHWARPPLHTHLHSCLQIDSRLLTSLNINQQGINFCTLSHAGPGAFGAEVGATFKSFGRIHAGVGGNHWARPPLHTCTAASRSTVAC